MNVIFRYVIFSLELYSKLLLFKLTVIASSTYRNSDRNYVKERTLFMMLVKKK